MAYTVGKFGLASLGPLARLIGTFWLTSVLFVVLVLGAIARAAGFSIFVSCFTSGGDPARAGHEFLRRPQSLL